ncbi:hypothetical protein PVAND_011528 [Polypedilum vanderplanki]|uniref:Ig-like domain-containing protein n=1 Tax=Polypedilum vanderplanki TaxID=319348 RepID=A0A9J6CJI2_POLVA|nr:hypothetical protein PVAND_011528 [Polypedilum vanderplanki]
METTILIRIIISILYWLQFNNLFTKCDGDNVITNSTLNKNVTELNHTNEILPVQPKTPFFESNQNLNVTVLENESVVLKCAVRFKGNKTISWIRKSDLHILTSENFVFSGDPRFTVIHAVDSNEWNLKIENITTKDSGYYECQVNTEPKIKLSVHLEVTVPEVLQERMIASANSFDGKVKFAKLIGSSEIHVKVGSTISLTCVVNHHVPSIQWYHNAHVIEFNSNRGGISLETEKNADGTTSRLMLTRASFRDGGNYTCVPHGALSASGFVHVLNGEHPAAKYTSNAVTCFSNSITVPCTTFLLLYHHYTSRKVVNFFARFR